MTSAPLAVEFCGEWLRVEPQTGLGIGRAADLVIDDNPFLHRRFLQLTAVDDLWWIANVGSRLSAVVTGDHGGLQAWLAPGARLPVAFATTTVTFTAGATTYELTIHCSTATFSSVALVDDEVGQTTLGSVGLTVAQKCLVLALAEPVLRRDGTGMSALPSSAQAAERLGWTLTRFNRKLDNVCDKLDRAGVRGLRGVQGRLASTRRARLVEHAVSSRLVTAGDLHLLGATGPHP